MSDAVGSWPPWTCPEHGCSLDEAADGSTLRCPEGHTYPVRGGIPRFVAADGYAEAFGLQWLEYRTTQLDSVTGTTISRDRVRAALGHGLWASLPGMQILEAGCGAGRFTEVLLERGAWVTSIDLSRAVEANERNFSGTARHRVAQASLLDPPFAPRSFDLVICLGVVQHTPDPERAVAALYEQVTPGGWLAFDHYTYSFSRATKTAPLFRSVLKRLPPSAGMPATRLLVRALFPLHRVVRSRPLLSRLVSRISPVLTYFRGYPQLSDEHQYQWALLDTHDALTDRYKHLRSREELEALVRRLGGGEVLAVRGGNGVEVRCRRPEGGRPRDVDT